MHEVFYDAGSVRINRNPCVNERLIGGVGVRVVSGAVQRSFARETPPCTRAPLLQIRTKPALSRSRTSISDSGGLPSLG